MDGVVYRKNKDNVMIKMKTMVAFHQPTSPMRVSATRRFFFGGCGGALSCSSLSTGAAVVVSLALATGPDSGSESLSGTALLAGVKGRFDNVRGDRDGGRETVDVAGVVDGVSVDDEVSGTE